MSNAAVTMNIVSFECNTKITIIILMDNFSFNNKYRPIEV